MRSEPVYHLTRFKGLLDPASPMDSDTRRLGLFLAAAVQTATALNRPGVVHASPLPCPGFDKKTSPCPGHGSLLLAQVPPLVQFWCDTCGAKGRITSWKKGPWDLRLREGEEARQGDLLRVSLSEDEYRCIMWLPGADRYTTRVLRSAIRSEAGIQLDGTIRELRGIWVLVVSLLESREHPDNKLLERVNDELLQLLT